MAFARAVRQDDAAGTDAAARTLIGLGPGLTPAADDVLGGLLAAGRFLARLLGSDVVVTRLPRRPGATRSRRSAPAR